PICGKFSAQTAGTGLRGQVIPYSPSRSDHPEVTSFLVALQEAAHRIRARSAPVVSHNPVETFASEVRMWLEVMRYVVDDQTRESDHCISMTAVLQQGALRQRVLVHRVGAEVGPQDILSLQKSLDIQSPEGWIIADRRISPRASAIVSFPIRLFTLAEF